MSRRYFLDSNIVIYTFDSRAPNKKARAIALLEQALGDGRGMISSQVVQEFLAVATRKFAKPLRPEDRSAYLDQVLIPLCRIYPSPALFADALEIVDRWRYSFYDSLIIAAARQGACDILYSEDMQNGQQIGDLTIVNPFAG